MDNLLKEAIADAKAVRETALENAKMALEEAFTPKIQSMLSKKIQMEMDDEDEKVDEAEHDEDEDVEERAKMARDGDELEERGDEDEVNEEDDEDVEEGIIEIDGVKYAPVVSEEEEDEVEEEMDDEKMEDDEDDDLDLEAVIKELESEINEEDEEELDENDVSSDIGKSDNKVNAKANDSSNVGNDGKAKLKEEDEKEDDDEDIDLDEVLKALSEEEDEEKEMDEVSELKSNLAEHRSVIEELRGKLNEVNLLNAKLLFTNKLFRKYGLNNEQKMKVVEQFDRASNLREVKLVYSTLGENFGSTRKNEINESKGSASKPVASTKSEKEVITEGSELRDRFKKLANLI